MSKINLEEYQNLLKYLGKRIDAEMKHQNLDQAAFAEHLEISQASISNIINGKESVSIKKYLDALEYLKLNFSEEMSLFLKTSPSISSAGKNYFQNLIPENSQNIICDPNNDIFNGQLGDFNIIFHSTNRNENSCIHGLLNLSSQGNHCIAELELKTGDIKDNNLNRKIYIGFAVISVVQKAVYVFLTSEVLGEICLLIYPYMRIARKGAYLQGTMALAITISSGIDSRRPTAHRIFLSRNKLKEKDEQLILSQLLLNKSEILISQDNYNRLCRNHPLSAEFMQHFEQHRMEEIYYKIDEDQFKSLLRKNKEIFNELCLLRTNSISPKNNKINEKIINNIFRYILEES